VCVCVDVCVCVCVCVVVCVSVSEASCLLRRQSDELCVLRYIARSRALCCAGVAVFRTRFCLRPNLNYRGADNSLAQPGRRQTNASVRMACISFDVLPYRGRGNLMTARVSMLLKSRALVLSVKVFC